MTSASSRGLERDSRVFQLQQAALSGDKSRVRGLLLHQGVPLVDAETKRLCLYLAVSGGDRTLATRVLETGYDVSCSLTRQGDTALHLAARAPIPDLLLFRRLVQQAGPSGVGAVNDNGDTSLHIAAMKGHVEPAAMLLSSGACVKAQNRSGDTPLHCAVRGEHTRMACLLLVHGADTTCENHRLELPILIAAKQRQDYILRVLLNQRLPPDLRVRKALTKCLRNAVLKGDSELACLLLHRGAYVNGLVKGRESVLHLAASRGDSALLKVLVSAGVDVNALSDDVTALHCASQRGHADAVGILLANGAAVNTTTNDLSLSLTALHLATAGRHRCVVEELCRFGGDANARDSTGNTPLHTASAQSPPGKDLYDVYKDPPDPILHSLLQAGADPTIRNREGDMPHHLAAHAANTIHLHHLALAGGTTTLHVHDGYGDTAISAVTTLRRTDLFLLLLAHGAKPNMPSKSENNDIFLDTLDRALLVYQAILNSGNLSIKDHRQYCSNVHELLGQTKSAFCSVLGSLYGGHRLTLKGVVRLYLRRYLLYKCGVTRLWQSISSLNIPSLLERYLLLQDFIESLKHIS